MEITEIRVKLVGDGRDKLKHSAASRSATILILTSRSSRVRGHVRRDAEPETGRRFPPRGVKNQSGLVRNECGTREVGRDEKDERAGRGSHADIAHPISSRCRVCTSG